MKFLSAFLICTSKSRSQLYLKYCVSDDFRHTKSSKLQSKITSSCMFHKRNTESVKKSLTMYAFFIISYVSFFCCFKNLVQVFIALWDYCLVSEFT